MSEALPADGWVGLEGEEALELELLRRAQRGERDAFRSIVELHQRRVHRFCFRYLRDEEDAREACQDTFVRAYRALGRFQPRARLSSWLMRIALNLCRDRARRRRERLLPLEACDESLCCPGASPDEAAIREAELAMLDRGLAALPEKHRSVLALVCLEGLSHRECAEVLKCSERAVEGRVYRARQRLAAWWRRQGLD